MLRVDTYIEIGNWKFDHCVDIEIINSIDSLTDTCKITLPRKYKWMGADIAAGDSPIIRRKQKVLVKAGYDGELKTQFIGYVKSVKAGVPVTIECEDSMFLLKQEPRDKLTLRNGLKLRQWLDEIVPKGIEVICDDMVLGDLRATKQTPAEILQWLKNKYGIYSFFRNNKNGVPVLHCGLAYSSLINERVTGRFKFESNMINANDLVYMLEEDARIKVKAIGVTGKNTKKEIQVGDGDGELRTVHFYNVDLDTLKKLAINELNRFKYTGYRGSFQTFGEPSVDKGDIANIIGNRYHPDGSYLINKVTKKISVTGGYRQTIEPLQIVNDKGINTSISR